jgi:hypothetical protein
MSWKLSAILSLLFLSCALEEPENYSASLEGAHYLEIPHSADIAYLEKGSHTAQFWFRADSNLQDYSQSLLMLCNASGGNEYGLYLSRNFGDTWLLYAGDSLQGIIRFAIDVRDGQFHYLSLTIDYQQGAATLRLDTLSERIAWPDSLEFAGSNLLIGADYDAFNNDVGNFWLGAIDEVRIWREALPDSTLDFHFENPAKVTRHYNSVWKNRLIGLWRMNRLKNGIIYDDSGHKNHAKFISITGEIRLRDLGFENP